MTTRPRALKIALSLAILSLWGSQNAQALPHYGAGSDLSQLTDPAVAALIQTVGFGLDHRAFMPATSLGVAGLDIGMDVTGIRRPVAFIDAMRDAGVAATFPDIFYFPRFSAHKGLPWNLDVGLSLLTYQGNRIIGADLKWAFLNPDAKEQLPTIALRLSRCQVHVFFMDTGTTKADLVISKALPFFDPYVGFGMQWVSGKLDVTVEQAAGMRVQGSYSRRAPHVYFGIPFRLWVGSLSVEYDYSFIKMTTFGAKISFAL